MHPYHIKEYTDERVAEKLRSASHHQLLAAARAGQAADSNPASRGRGFRLPTFNWRPRVQPARPMRAAR